MIKCDINLLVSYSVRFYHFCMDLIVIIFDINNFEDVDRPTGPGCVVLH